MSAAPLVATTSATATAAAPPVLAAALLAPAPASLPVTIWRPASVALPLLLMVPLPLPPPLLLVVVKLVNRLYRHSTQLLVLLAAVPPVVQPQRTVLTQTQLHKGLLLLAVLHISKVDLVGTQPAAAVTALGATEELALAGYNLGLRAPAQADLGLFVPLVDCV